MTLPTSGPLSLQDINAEFGRGKTLGAYRNTTYYVLPDPVARRFPILNISIEDFYGTSLNGPGPATDIIFSSVGTHSFVVPSYTSMTIEIWGGGGGGGAANTDLQSSFGGNGGSYVKYNVAYGGLTAGSTETVYVGGGGSGGSGAADGGAGDYSQFGESIWAAGGNGGAYGSSSGTPATPYTPTNPRPSVFTLLSQESGSVTTNTVWAGAGGQGGFFFLGQPYYGSGPGLSTLGGSGGAAGILSAAVDGENPGGGGGGGASPSGGSGGSGGNGKIYINWTT